MSPTTAVEEATDPIEDFLIKGHPKVLKPVIKAISKHRSEIGFTLTPETAILGTHNFSKTTEIKVKFDSGNLQEYSHTGNTATVDCDALWNHVSSANMRSAESITITVADEDTVEVLIDGEKQGEAEIFQTEPAPPEYNSEHHDSMASFDWLDEDDLTVRTQASVDAAKLHRSIRAGRKIVGKEQRVFVGTSRGTLTLHGMAETTEWHSEFDDAVQSESNSGTGESNWGSYGLQYIYDVTVTTPRPSSKDLELRLLKSDDNDDENTDELMAGPLQLRYTASYEDTKATIISNVASGKSYTSVEEVEEKAHNTAGTTALEDWSNHIQGSTFTASSAYQLDPIVEIPVEVDEIKLTYDEDGLQARVVDSANVFLTDFSISPSYFEDSTIYGEGEVGLSLSTFENLYSVLLKRHEATISIDQNTNSLYLSSPIYSARMTLFDPETIRQSPSMPDIDFDGKITGNIDNLVDTLPNNPPGDHMKIATAGGEGYVLFDGDTETELHTIGNEATGKINSLFSWDYVENSIDGLDTLPEDTSYTIHGGDSIPMRVQFESDTGISGSHSQAPRINDTASTSTAGDYMIKGSLASVIDKEEAEQLNEALDEKIAVERETPLQEFVDEREMLRTVHKHVSEDYESPVTGEFPEKLGGWTRREHSPTRLIYTRPVNEDWTEYLGIRHAERHSPNGGTEFQATVFTTLHAEESDSDISKATKLTSHTSSNPATAVSEAWNSAREYMDALPHEMEFVPQEIGQWTLDKINTDKTSIGDETLLLKYRHDDSDVTVTLSEKVEESSISSKDKRISYFVDILDSNQISFYTAASTNHPDYVGVIDSREEAVYSLLQTLINLSDEPLESSEHVSIQTGTERSNTTTGDEDPTTAPDIQSNPSVVGVPTSRGTELNLAHLSVFCKGKPNGWSIIQNENKIQVLKQTETERGFTHAGIQLSLNTENQNQVLVRHITGDGPSGSLDYEISPINGVQQVRPHTAWAIVREFTNEYGDIIDQKGEIWSPKQDNGKIHLDLETIDTINSLNEHWPKALNDTWTRSTVEENMAVYESDSHKEYIGIRYHYQRDYWVVETGNKPWPHIADSHTVVRTAQNTSKALERAEKKAEELTNDRFKNETTSNSTPTPEDTPDGQQASLLEFQ